MIHVDTVEPLMAQAVGSGVVVGMIVSFAATLPLIAVDLAHRESSYADGYRPLARWRFPQAHAQAAAERRAGYRTRRGDRPRDRARA